MLLKAGLEISELGTADSFEEVKSVHSLPEGSSLCLDLRGPYPVQGGLQPDLAGVLFPPSCLVVLNVAQVPSGPRFWDWSDPPVERVAACFRGLLSRA